MVDIVRELIEIIPSILWFLLVVTVLVLFYRPLREELLPKLSSFEAGGLKLSFIKDSLDAAIELGEKSPQWQVEVPLEDKERAIRRAKRNLTIFKNAQLLWVDDHPENNLNERRMFRELGTEVDIAKSTEEALAMLENATYDLVISDMARGDQDTAGLEFLRKLRSKDKVTPVIYYIGVIIPAKGVPAQAFGITNRPDELLHLTLDILERKKY